MSEQPETTPDASSGSMITNPEHIKIMHRITQASALGLEINTGMQTSSRGSLMKAIAEQIGSSKRTKKGVLTDLVAHIKTLDPTWEPKSSIKKALGQG